MKKYEIGKTYTFDEMTILDIDTHSKLEENLTLTFTGSEYDEMFDETWLNFEDVDGYFYSFVADEKD